MTSLDISSLDMKRYRMTARKRWQQAQQKALQLQKHAWQVACQAAAILREQFGVTEVIVFGSLARGDLLHAHSDVDLAVSSLDERQYYRAYDEINYSLTETTQFGHHQDVLSPELYADKGLFFNRLNLTY
jgi:predicted nucleotidyltransferase